MEVRMKIYYKSKLSILLIFLLLFNLMPTGLAENDENSNNSYQIIIQYKNYDSFINYLNLFATKVQFDLIENIQGLNAVTLRTNSQQNADFLLDSLSAFNILEYANIYKGENILNTDFPIVNGTGTAKDPYQIFTENDLKALNMKNCKNFILMNDITLSSNWKPLECFRGNLNGNGHSINNIQFDDSSSDNLGFFESLSPTATILKLNMNANQIETDKTVGIIAGVNRGRILNCSVSGSISSTSLTAGIVGRNEEGGLIKDCINNIESNHEQNDIYTANVLNANSQTINLSGSGTEEDPYLITNKYELNFIRNDLTAYYKQTNDIIFDDSDYSENGDFYNGGYLFSPITLDSNQFAPFSGVYDGGGYKIVNLKMMRSGSYLGNAALFSFAESLPGEPFCYLKNINLVNANIIGDVEVAGIASSIDDIEVTGCSVSGTIQGTNELAAGIISRASASSIGQCVNYSNVSAKRKTAGICADGSDYSGIYSSYNTGTIESTEGEKASGITNSSYSITNCYNVGQIISGEEKLSGIKSNIETTNYGDYNYYLKTTNVFGTNDGDLDGKYIPLTEQQMTQQSSFVGFDFDTIWTINPTAEYPYPTLKCMAEEPVPEDTYEDAIVIYAEQNVESTLGSNNLLDWYCFKPKYNNLYKLIKPSTVNTELYKYSNNELIPVTIDSNGNQMNYLETYYIKVFGTGQYTLKINGVNLKTNNKAFEVKIGSDSYYSNLADGGKLYKNNSLAVEDFQSPVKWICTNGTGIYFNSNNKIYKLIGETITVFLYVDGNYLTIDDTYIYFSYWQDGGKIYKHPINGTNVSPILVCNDIGANLWLEGDYVYYQNCLDNGKIYRVLKNADNVECGEIVN